jgi:hypothetical protein
MQWTTKLMGEATKATRRTAEEIQGITNGMQEANEGT